MVLTKEQINEFRNIAKAFEDVHSVGAINFDLCYIISGQYDIIDIYKIRFWDGEMWEDLVSQDSFEEAIEKFRELFLLAQEKKTGQK